MSATDATVSTMLFRSAVNIRPLRASDDRQMFSRSCHSVGQAELEARRLRPVLGRGQDDEHERDDEDDAGHDERDDVEPPGPDAHAATLTARSPVAEEPHHRVDDQQ